MSICPHCRQRELEQNIVSGAWECSGCFYSEPNDEQAEEGDPMTPNEEKERELFEQWVTENHVFSHITADEFLDWHEGIKNYVMPEASWAWAAWLGRAALQAESEPVGDVVVSTNRSGEVVLVSRQNEEHQILSVIWESDAPYGAHEHITESTAPQTLPVNKE